ncbi:MAG: ATP-dependent helicase [Patescibacteria group bacterium]
MSIDFSRELNQEQLDAVLHGDGPCLVLAGAGSGKTRTVTYRVAHLLEKGVKPDSILLLTFTNKAAREMLERIGLLVGTSAKGVWGGTFHGTANRLLRSFASQIGYTSSFSILDEEDAKSLLKAVLKDCKIDPKARRFPSPAVIRNIFSYSLNTGISLKEAVEMKNPNFLDCVNDMEFVINQYRQRKLQSNAMDFDDLLWNWLLVMERNPQVADLIGNKFQHILVDEYQDTNVLQARIVGLVARAHKNIFVVGDDAQSIYAFRGADVKNILHFPDQWPGGKIFKLQNNYRSTPQILEVANSSLSNNVNQFEKELIGLKAQGLRPGLIACPSAKQEAEYVADQILLLRSQGVALANMAVLFRASSHSQALEFELMKRDIPFEYRGGVKFFERAHVKDVLAYLRIFQNPKDEPAWLRILNMQAGIGATSASQIISRIKDLAGMEEVLDPQVMLVPSRAVEGWRGACDMLALMRATDNKPGRILSAIAMSEMYRTYLEREYPDWKDRAEDLEQLAQFAGAYMDIPSFLADTTLEGAGFVSGQTRDVGRRTSDDERIVLSTIHQAKGLEWDTVFVIHVTNLGFPNPRALEDEASIEEERRLFYVAVTRAKNRLFVTYPQVMGYDAMSFCRPSMFIEELPPRLFEQMNIASAQLASRSSHLGTTRDVGRRTWDDDGSYDEPTIQIGNDGENQRGTYWNSKQHEKPITTSVWKKPEEKKQAPRISFLRDVDEL